MINTTPDPIYTNEDHAFDKLESKLPNCKDAIIKVFRFERKTLLLFGKNFRFLIFFLLH